jgi:hypothetical protein
VMGRKRPQRRHLDTSQRALVAARLATLGEGRPWPSKITAEISAVTQGQAADREFRLDQILLALWHGRLTADAAAERIVAEIGLGRQAARDEVAGFLRD